MDKYYAANAALSIFSRSYMALKEGLPIRPSEMAVLNIIAQTPGPHTPVMLAGYLGVSKAMITAHLNSLSENGYITRAQSLEDKRVNYALLTRKARELVESSRQQLHAQLMALEKAMGEDEFDILVRLTREANHVLSSIKTREESE